MARLTFEVCDLCGKYSEEELSHRIILDDSLENIEDDGDICQKCYEALASRLKQEIKPQIPSASLKGSRSDRSTSPVPLLQAHGINDIQGELVLGTSDNIIYDEGDGVNIVPSNLTDSRRRELNKQKSEKCEHSRGFTMEDDGHPHCKDCLERVTL